MGNQSSQLERPGDDLDQSQHDAQANYTSVAHDNSPDSQSYNLNPSEFVFSSQVPQSIDPPAKTSRRRNLYPDYTAEVESEAEADRDTAGPPRSPVLKFEGVESPVDKSEQLWPSKSHTDTKRRRSTLKHSSPTTDAHLSKPNMDPFTTQPPHDFDASFGTPFDAFSQEQSDPPGQQEVMNGDPIPYNLPVPSSEKPAKRGRKEKKQQKADSNSAQMPETSPSHDAYPHIEDVGYSLPDYSSIPQEDYEQPKPSKKRKRKSKLREVEHHQDSLSFGDDAATSLNKLPPLDNDLNALIPANYIDPALTMDAPTSRRRKSKDHSKKVHKKQKHNQDTSNDFHNGPDNVDREGHEQSIDQTMDDIAESLEGENAVDDPSSIDHSFGDIAQSLYADHVKSQNAESSQPNSSQVASPAQHDDDEGPHVDLDMGSDKGDNNNINENTAASVDDEVYEARDEINSPSASGSEHLSGGIAKYETRSDSTGAEESGRPSDDLGLNEAVGVSNAGGNSVLGDHDHTTEKVLFTGGPDSQIEVPASAPVQNDGLPLVGTTQRTHTKLSSGRKRVPKPTFYDRVAEENVDGFAELPSPAAAAASRKELAGKGHAGKQADRGGRETVAGPSNTAAKGKDKQPKITSMLGGGSSTPTKSTTPGPTPKSSTQVLRGIFSQFELRNINEAVDRWRQSHNMTQYEVNELIHANPKEVNSTDFWDSVTATCPNRLRQKVINQCRRRYHNFVARGTWTPEQNEELTKMYELHGMKYTLIGKLINRHPEDVRDRIRNYVICGDKMRRHAWSSEEENLLSHIVNEAIEHINNLQREEGASQDGPEELVDWQLVSERMGHTRSRLQCINKWKLLRSQTEGRSIDGGEILSVDQLIDKARKDIETMTSRERYNLVKDILASGVHAESRIPWAKIRKGRGGISVKRWTRPTLMLAWYRLRHLCADQDSLSVPEIATQLCSLYKSTRTLEYPSIESIDLDLEHRQLGRKINMLLKGPGNRSSKAPRHTTESDDEDEADEQSENADNSDVLMEDALHDDRGSSIDLGLGTDIVKGESDEVSEVETEDPVPYLKTPKSRLQTKALGSSGLTRGSKGSSKKRSSKAEEGSPVNSAKKMMARRKTSRSRRHQPPLATPATNSEDDQSSDTNASEAESIPARRPE